MTILSGGIRYRSLRPNAATVYQNDLPDPAQASGGRTDIDFFVEGLAEKGVKTVDLRPVMAAAKPEGPIYYRRDSRWTPRGALAAFNAIVRRTDIRFGGWIRLGPRPFRSARAAISRACSAFRTASPRRSKD